MIRNQSRDNIFQPRGDGSVVYFFGVFHFTEGGLSATLSQIIFV